MVSSRVLNIKIATSCGLIQDGLFTSWKYRFLSLATWHPTVVIELFHYAFYFFNGELIPSSLLS